MNYLIHFKEKILGMQIVIREKVKQINKYLCFLSFPRRPFLGVQQQLPANQLPAGGPADHGAWNRQGREEDRRRVRVELQPAHLHRHRRHVLEAEREGRLHRVRLPT